MGLEPIVLVLETNALPLNYPPLLKVFNADTNTFWFIN